MTQTIEPATPPLTLGNGQPKPAGTWDWYGTYDPAHQRPADSVLFSVGVFQWLAKKGSGVKRGKSVARFSGSSGHPQTVYVQALRFIARQEARQQLPPQSAATAPRAAIPEPPAAVAIATEQPCSIKALAAPLLPTVPVSGIVRRPGQEQATLAHSAVIHVVGWTSQDRRGAYLVGGIRVEFLPDKWLGRRVRVSLYPSTQYPTRDVLRLCRVARIREAKSMEANTAGFEIVGHLLQADRSAQRARVRVWPQTQDMPSFFLNVRTTQAAIRACDPTWTGVKITGSLLDGLLLAEEIVPVYAPRASHWDHSGRPGRRQARPMQEQSAGRREEDHDVE